jgi:cysteine desulfurase/selenocysteine lyase
VSDDVIDTLEPRTIGYRGVVTPTDETYEFEPSARRFEIGTTNPAPYVALQTAIETLDEIGLDTVESRIQQLTTRLVNGVPDDRLFSSTSPASGLVTIDVDDPATAVDRFKETNIIIRSLPDPDAIRASLHVFNTQEDIETLLEELSNAR